jgi:DNA-binding Lrp family transcriptional regulator
LENVFAEVNAEITTDYSEEVRLEKPKRSAFVFITAEDSSIISLEDLKKIDEVEEVYLARGAYDLVAKVSGESFEYLKENVLKRIRNLSGIKSTLTLTVV